MPRKKKALQQRPRTGANQRRKSLNKKINQQLLREKIAAGNHHTQILKTLNEIITMEDNLSKRKTPMTRDEQAKFMCLLGAKKTRLDSQFKLLGKYLPDLRTIQLEDDDPNKNPLVHAAKAWAEALSQGVVDGG